MDILGQLLQQATGATGGDAGAAPQVDVGALAQQFGLTPDQANAAVGALLPAVLGGLKKVEQGGGLGSVADIAGATTSPATDTDAGNAVLGQIFGSKDVSRSVATAASAQTGISDTIMKAMLPIVAGLVAQQVSKKMGACCPGGTRCGAGRRHLRQSRRAGIDARRQSRRQSARRHPGHGARQRSAGLNRSLPDASPAKAGAQSQRFMLDRCRLANWPQ
jgi:hypothetical protein